MEQAYIITALPGNRFGLGIVRPNYSDILPNNVLYPGGFFAIQEIAEISLAITDLALIDTDLTWFETVYYVGKWQVLVNTGITDVNGNLTYSGEGTNQPEYSGVITNTTVILQRISYHSIGDITREPRLIGVSHINGCNPLLVPSVIIGEGDPQAGFLYQNDVDIFTTKNYIVPPPLVDKEFFPKLGGIGLYLNPGIEIVDATWKAAVINVLSIASPVEEAYTCSVEGDCTAQLAAAIAPDELNPSNPTEGTNYWTTFEGAFAYGGEFGTFEEQFPCADGTFLTYWRANVF